MVTAVAVVTTVPRGPGELLEDGRVQSHLEE